VIVASWMKRLFSCGLIDVSYSVTTFPAREVCPSPRSLSPEVCQISAPSQRSTSFAGDGYSHPSSVLCFSRPTDAFFLTRDRSSSFHRRVAPTDSSRRGNSLFLHGRHAVLSTTSITVFSSLHPREFHSPPDPPSPPKHKVFLLSRTYPD